MKYRANVLSAKLRQYDFIMNFNHFCWIPKNRYVCIGVGVSIYLYRLHQLKNKTLQTWPHYTVKAVRRGKNCKWGSWVPDVWVFCTHSLKNTREEKRHRHLRKTTNKFERDAPAGFPETEAALRTEDAHPNDLDHVHAHQHWADNVFSAEFIQSFIQRQPHKQWYT